MIYLASFFAALVMFPSQASAAETCRNAMMRQPVVQLIKPLLELRVRQSRDEFTDDGRWKGESAYTPEVERRFERLLKNRTKAGDEALAYLLNVYMGEHLGEELVREVTNRGKRMLPLIETYERCTPLTGLEPLPRAVRGSGALPQMAKDGALSGKKCRYTD